ncbi:hypothetical protein CR513_08893, partial [Mucuna pruriens]
MGLLTSPSFACSWLFSNPKFFYSNPNIKWIVKCREAFTNELTTSTMSCQYIRELEDVWFSCSIEKKNDDGFPGKWESSLIICIFILITFQIANLSNHFDTNAYELHYS